MNRNLLFIPLAALVLAAVLSSVFVVDERHQALVLRFGEIVEEKPDPGLYFKVPVVNEVVYYDKRILGLDVPQQEITPSNNRRLIVDAFARYLIADPVRLRQAVGAGGEQAAEQRLAFTLSGKLRDVLGEVDSAAILSESRASLAQQIMAAAQSDAASLGIRIVDVRLRRTDLPEQNLEATFARMRAEREREAADQIARGNEEAQRRRAGADRSVVETVSDAKRQSEIIRGEADAKRTAILAAAYGADPAFFDFYRSLSSYRQALQSGNSTMVMSPDSEFFEFLKSSTGTGDALVPAPAAPAADLAAPASN